MAHLDPQKATTAVLWTHSEGLLSWGGCTWLLQVHPNLQLLETASPESGDKCAGSVLCYWV